MDDGGCTSPIILPLPDRVASRSSCTHTVQLPNPDRVAVAESVSRFPASYAPAPLTVTLSRDTAPLTVRFPNPDRFTVRLSAANWLSSIFPEPLKVISNAPRVKASAFTFPNPLRTSVSSDLTVKKMRMGLVGLKA